MTLILWAFGFQTGPETLNKLNTMDDVYELAIESIKDQQTADAVKQATAQTAARKAPPAEDESRFRRARRNISNGF